jgi:periplasmic divalent cation tolerance protein
MADADAPRVVLSTAPDAAVARELARALVERRLAACVNLVPGAASVYRWRGAVEEASEVLLVIKSRAGAADELERVWRELHPYEVPELVELALGRVEERYRRWWMEETAPPGREP